MQTITSKLFSAVRCGIIKSNKMFWDLYADIETIDELDLDTNDDQQYLEKNGIKIKHMTNINIIAILYFFMPTTP